MEKGSQVSILVCSEFSRGVRACEHSTNGTCFQRAGETRESKSFAAGSETEL